MGRLAGRREGVEGRGMGGSGTLKLRNEPNFSAKKPMKAHECPKKRTQFKANGEAGFAIQSGF